jgi:hypothetical protein
MSRVLLVSANTTLEPYPVFLGMALVAGALAARGHGSASSTSSPRGGHGASCAKSISPPASGSPCATSTNDSTAAESAWY